VSTNGAVAAVITALAIMAVVVWFDARCLADGIAAS
jgi:hypothetical protein